MNKLILIGTIIVLFFSAIAILAPIIAPYDPAEIDIENILRGPSKEHILGTDSLGRDLFSRMVYGTRISLLVGFIAVGISALIGIVLGSLAGYYGKWVDVLIMRFVDIMLCFPTFFLILAVIALLEPSIINIMVIIGVTSWMGVARLIRAEILSLKERDFIYAERAIGASDVRIIVHHLIPNAMAPVLVSITLGIAAAILVESSLSFLGIGVQPPTPSWGNILSEGKSVMGAAWWMVLFPGLAIFITVLGYNLLGEGIRERLLKT
ncbi:MAG: ABC transporter permease [Candidatus Omnitrophota bacterium]|jgi:peptide/nickel transport system permease protein|nr:ABC transporter permease [Candidatus Omnitrophota bacterium]|tara:strand:- start:43 stop:837 length:795 start_codon:yes stop_codon:yes gene_type:complete